MAVPAVGGPVRPVLGTSLVATAATQQELLVGLALDVGSPIIVLGWTVVTYREAEASSILGIGRFAVSVPALVASPDASTVPEVLLSLVELALAVHAYRAI